MSSRVAQFSCLFLFVIGAATLPGADSQYTVKEGETLFSVARRAQIPVAVITVFNGISDASRVKAGTVLRIPAVYTVKKGDTLYGIARTFGVPAAKLLELNKLAQNARLKVGERIFVPRDSGGEVVRVADQAQNPVRTGPSARADGAAPVSGGLAPVWPHAGRHETDNGKMPGLVFYGSAGDLVKSATAGEVKWAATYWTRGKVVIIKSVDGNLFTYGGNSELLVNVGDRVNPGTDIGKLGESLQGGGAKLYFSISDGSGRVVDPEKFFSAKSSS
jgi:murein DD-endopeptidase MepM/ murein hydrolase activator NlpD